MRAQAGGMDRGGTWGSVCTLGAAGGPADEHPTGAVLGEAFEGCGSAPELTGIAVGAVEEATAEAAAAAADGKERVRSGSRGNAITCQAPSTEESMSTENPELTFRSAASTPDAQLASPLSPSR